MTSPYLSKAVLAKLREEAKKVNPQGIPQDVAEGLGKSFASLMKDVRREGAIRTPHGRGFHATNTLKKELDI